MGWRPPAGPTRHPAHRPGPCSDPESNPGLPVPVGAHPGATRAGRRLWGAAGPTRRSGRGNRPAGEPEASSQEAGSLCRGHGGGKGPRLTPVLPPSGQSSGPSPWRPAHTQGLLGPAPPGTETRAWRMGREAVTAQRGGAGASAPGVPAPGPRGGRCSEARRPGLPPAPSREPAARRQVGPATWVREPGGGSALHSRLKRDLGISIV